MTRLSASLRSTGVAFVIASSLILIRAVLELWDPVYWDPQTALDYAAAILTTLSWVVAGTAFIMWFRATAEQRVRWLLALAGIGLAVSGIGNLLEDVFDMNDLGEALFTNGGLVGAVAIVATAVLVLTVPGPIRWTSVILFVFLVGSVFPDDGGQFVMGVSLLALGLWLIRIASARHQVPEESDPGGS